MYVNFNILNQLGSPSLNSNTFANRPAAGQTGRLFISTDTFEIYRDNGTGWDLIGTGTGGGITGSGTANQVTYWTGTSAVGGESAFTYNSTTNALRVNGNVSLNRDADNWTPNSVFTVGNGSFTSDVGGTYLTFNAYYNVDWKYSQNGVASFYAQANGGHIWYNASSGTAGNNCSLTIAMYLDDKENLGVATAPPNWYTDYNATIINTANVYGQKSTTVGGITSNAFIDNTAISWRYQITGLAARMEIDSGAVNWFTAPSGTLNTDITFTRRLRLTNNGHLNFNTADTTWGSTTRVIHFTQGMAIWSQTSNNANNYINTGLYWDGQLRRLTGSQSSQINFSEGLLSFSTASGGAANSVVTLNEGFRLTVSSNLLIGTTTDGGQRLQVSGDTMMTGTGITSASSSLTVRDSSATDLFKVRNDGNILLGVANTTTIAPASAASGAIAKNGGAILFNSTQTSTTGSTNGYYNFFGDAFGALSGRQDVMFIRRNFTPGGGTATCTQITTDPTISQSTGTGITRGLYVNPTLTAAADWRSVEMSNNSGWGIYQSGASANNYFNGDVLVGTTTDSGFKFDVNGSTRLNGTVRVDGQTAATAGGSAGLHLIVNCDGTNYKIALLNV